MYLNEPLISVVIPTYNRAQILPNTLKSFLLQSFRNFEIIIVDDGSTDDTYGAIQAYLNDNVRYVRKTNAERAAARNYGANLARGKYINFFDSDDLALSNHTEEAAKYVQLHGSPEWFHLGYEWTTPARHVVKRVNQFTGHDLNAQMAQGNLLSCNGVFLRRDIIIEHPFNEDPKLSGSEDYELWMRLSARFPLYYSNVITSQIVDHDQRSVRTINPQRLIVRLDRLIHYLERDAKVLSYFGKSFRYTRLDSWSYVALHLANNKTTKITCVRYLIKSLRESPILLLKRRFYATLKNIFIKW